MNNNFPPVSLFNDDCLAVLRTLPDNSIDSIVTDPPYGLSRTPDKGNHHPTVKPVALMEYLCRLVTPAGGLVLDPFMGSGTTGKAAIREGFHFIGIEQNESYFAIAQERISFEKPPVSAALLTEQANA